MRQRKSSPRGKRAGRIDHAVIHLVVEESHGCKEEWREEDDEANGEDAEGGGAEDGEEAGEAQVGREEVTRWLRK